MQVAIFSLKFVGVVFIEIVPVEIVVGTVFVGIVFVTSITSSYRTTVSPILLHKHLPFSEVRVLGFQI